VRASADCPGQVWSGPLREVVGSERMPGPDGGAPAGFRAVADGDFCTWEKPSRSTDSAAPRSADPHHHDRTRGTVMTSRGLDREQTKPRFGPLMTGRRASEGRSRFSPTTPPGQSSGTARCRVPMAAVGALTELRQQVPRLLSHPRTGWMGIDTAQMPRHHPTSTKNNNPL